MKIRFSTYGFELGSELEKYATAKIAHLGKQVPRKLRPSAVCEVVFTFSVKKEVELNTCSVTLTLGDIQLKAEETTLHMYAALDVAVVHLEQQLADYLARQHKHPVRIKLKRRLGTG